MTEEITQAEIDRYMEFQTQAVDRAMREWGDDVQDKVCLVTGGARGMGRVLAESLVDAGAKVAVGDVSWEGADEFRSTLEQESACLALDMDITDQASVDRAYDKLTDGLGSVDVLLNNAGLVSETLFAPKGKVLTLDTSDDDWRKMFGVNVFGTMNVIRRFVPSMVSRGRGSVINVVSSGVLFESVGGAFFGARPWTKEMPYQSSKSALTTLSFYLAQELEASGVSVNAFMPGHTRASWFDATAAAIREEGRIYALRPMAPQHVVPLILFLSAQSTPSHDLVTGRLFHVPDWNYDHGYGGLKSWGDYDLPESIEQDYRTLEAAMPDYWRAGLARARFDAERAAYGAGMEKVRNSW